MIAGFAVAVTAAYGLMQPAAAQQPSDFSLQVTPSPIVTTLKPGTQTTLEMKIRNAGTGTENLKIEPRKFTVDKKSGEVKLDDTTAPDIASWISYSSPKFTVKPGEWFTQKITIALPKDTGFSYSLALVISRTNAPDVPSASTRLIKGSVAVFTLINVDRPGATRKLEIEKFSTSAGIYEYLPATVNINFKNIGNTIVQPYGNVFIQHGSGDQTPIATLPVNDKGGYILPGSERLLTTNWEDGFPRYEISKDASGNEKKTEIWDWSKLSNFRIGRYTAKLIAVYNDGQRDVPIEQEITFWVLPWKIMLGALVVVLVLGLGIWTVLRKFWSLLKRSKKRAPKSGP
ncbi:MAG: exported protein of unknown function [Candidatus Saccharibacteria bacterium]|nr:exported protein of unknown function [Candidatus Saccharibacteria bacterium]